MTSPCRRLLKLRYGPTAVRRALSPVCAFQGDLVTKGQPDPPLVRSQLGTEGPFAVTELPLPSVRAGTPMRACADLAFKRFSAVNARIKATASSTTCSLHPTPFVSRQSPNPQTVLSGPGARAVPSGDEGTPWLPAAGCGQRRGIRNRRPRRRQPASPVHVLSRQRRRPLHRTRASLRALGPGALLPRTRGPGAVGKASVNGQKGGTPVSAGSAHRGQNFSLKTFLPHLEICSKEEGRAGWCV